jgi:SAM-dependent methyltransferase
VHRLTVRRLQNPALPRTGRGHDLLEVNRRFYDPLWADAQLVEPERFNTWPLVASVVSPSRPRLEIAPGLRPRLPIDGTQFVDISLPAIGKLRARGASAVLGMVSKLPFPDQVFDPVCALDIIEHVDDEDAALSEISRVAMPGAALLLSVPLHLSSWTSFDDLVGHRRRYEPERLIAKLVEHGLVVERSAAYGMKPKSSALVDLGMWFLEHRRERAMWCYGSVLMPLALRLQKKLTVCPGLISTEQVDEVLLVCRKEADRR